LAALIVLALEIAWLTVWKDAVGSGWPMLIPPLLLVWPAEKWLRWRLTRTTISGDRLRYETGMASKTTRNIQLSKVQDVRVDQRLTQRLLDIGDLSIETAGESSRLVIHNVDSPQQLADEIMNRAQHGPSVNQY
jgi:uncharacterized membrane protein YdbT with pleckstrin-like domain